MVQQELIKVALSRAPLHHQFIQIAKYFENKVAFIDRGLKKRFTYGRSLTACLVLADKLKRIDSPLVGVMLPTSAAAAFISLALLMVGKIPVFLNYSTGIQTNVGYGRKKCDFELVITARGLLEKLKSPTFEGLVFIEDLLKEVSLFDKAKAKLRTGLSAERILQRFPSSGIDATAAILFTAGSEQEPKAVPLTHRNIVANLEALSQVYPFSADDVMLANLPFFHAFGLTTNLWLPLRFGMTIVSAVNPMDYKTICTTIAEERPTYLVGTPSFLWGYLHHSHPGDFKSVKLIVTGADKCPETLRQLYREKHGIEIYEGYGATETSPIISVNTVERNRPGSVGCILPNLQIRMERQDTGMPCATGEIGKILVKGESVFSGYFDDQKATDTCFCEGWYDTGDMGYLDGDGYLWHVGRLRRFVKIGGEMVSLGYVEEILEALLPANTLCCVVEVPDVKKGSKIVAVITQPIDERQALRAMSRQIPAIALPKQFILLSELPMMATGKKDFKQIQKIVQEMTSL
jgi:acyl-[acyl-carrier-protein]-phospholipid O-acyltransferase / long-chain-fatty-acid--[acyl-carrier-protein] ligase